MKLKELLPDYLGKVSDDKLNSVSLNSQEISKGDLYISIAKDVSLQKKYCQEALKNGASFVLTNNLSIENLPKKIIFVKNLEKKLGLLSNKIYENPSKKITVFGITGTNGKSSVSYYLFQLFNQIKMSSGLISNVNLKNPGICISKLTTPDIFSLNKILNNFLLNKKEAAIFEVSSHGIKQKRVEGISFDYGCLTSFSRDHLDYHSSMKEYEKVKESFFADNKFKGGVINADSKVGKRILLKNKEFLSISMEDNKSDIFIDKNKGKKVINSPWGNLEIPNQIFADHKMLNIAAALGLFCLSSNKINLSKLNLEKIKDLPGRLEKINVALNKDCYIDYAHTPDALEKVLQSLKNKYQGNLICLFGCGGDRDQGKRVLMGSVADSLADKIILTNDNPRFENPNQIVMHISEGIKNIKKVKIITDRTKAIKYGLKLLKEEKEESVLLLAGKGHESNQEIKRKTIYSNDYEIVRGFI